MTARHSMMDFYAGDDWLINGTLYDADGQLQDLGGATIEWALIDRSGNRVFLATSPDDISIPGPDGICQIQIDSTDSEAIPPGEYSDRLRVTISSNRDTFWTGPVRVNKDAFAQQTP